MNFKKFLILSVFLFNAAAVSQAQVFAVTDKSEAHIKRIKNTISNNKEIVKYIEYTLQSRGLPSHLRNLSLLESGFVNSSISSAGAVGIWQIMPDHAAENGLSQQDRADIYRSTQTAANSLTKLYNKYRDWITVLAAYNCGEGNIAKAMEKAGSTYYEDYYVYLPNETTNSIKKYINACYATGELSLLLKGTRIRNANSKGSAEDVNTFSVIGENAAKRDPNLQETKINAAYNLDVIAVTIKVSLSDLLKWNPGIETEILSQPEVYLYLPATEMGSFKANERRILKNSLLK